MTARRRILIATDAWPPQVNGVVRTLTTTVGVLESMGHAVEVVAPPGFVQLPNPFYPEIRLALARPGVIDRRVARFRPDHVHISTEGPIGWLVRRYCLMRGVRFSTSYHTRFPEYLHTLARVPTSVGYRVMRHFHDRAGAMMVATPSLERELQDRGFTAPMRRWSRGVDLSVFGPREREAPLGPPPVMLYAGRVSAEKGIADFLALDVPGTKVIVGDGPARADLARRFPAAVFLGYKRGAELAACYAAADVFVFPSRTDTFGIVLIEALACGVPVAAYPVTGPVDIVTRPGLGALDADLGAAVRRALATGDRAACAAEGATYTWESCTRQFVANLVPAR